MAQIPMEIAESGQQYNSFIYFSSLSLNAGTYSDEYVLPSDEIYAIATDVNGDGNLQLTNEKPEDISGSSNWVDYDGVSDINLGITGFRLKRNSGTVTAKVTVKTANP